MENDKQVHKTPKSGRGLGHVTSTIFGSTVGYPSDSLASCVISTPSSDLCTDWRLTNALNKLLSLTYIHVV